MTKMMIAAAIVMASVGSAAAQTSGTPEDQRACSASVQKFCARVGQGGDMAILACLQQNRQRIARACQGVLIKYGQ